MMKSYLLTLVLLLASAAMLWGQTINITVNNTNRSYILYIPANLDASTPAPLVFNFHGYTSNAFQQQIYANMNAVADTAGFIVVYAEGLNASWNSFTPLLTTPNDVAFTNAIIDDVNRRRSVDPARVYACGMSNGGYMSYLLGCQLENRIAAVASVTGLLAPGIMAVCNPSRPVPVLQIHGTNDITVPYNGGFGIGSVDSTVQFWLAQNNCPGANTVIDTMPNTNTGDNSYPIRYRTEGCEDGSEVMLIKIVSGGHTWPNAPILIPGLVTNQDFDGSAEVWRFFAKHTHPNPSAMDTVTSIATVANQPKLIKTYPNPMGNQLTVEVLHGKVNSIALYDVLGAKIYDAAITSLPAKVQIYTGNLPHGIYFLRADTGNGVVTYKLMK